MKGFCITLIALLLVCGFSSAAKSSSSTETAFIIEPSASTDAQQPVVERLAPVPTQERTNTFDIIFVILVLLVVIGYLLLRKRHHHRHVSPSRRRVRP